ncbi:MAG: glucokinase [Blastocatellia bacterium]|nr:glucokinase [Blastocatellia bacterium]
MILAGDIGGTKTLLALFDSKLTELEKRSFPSRDYNGLEAIISEFLGDKKCGISSSCFGVAGPVTNGRSSITNLTWTMTEEGLAEFLDCEKVALINDLEANGYGIPALPETSFHTLQEGEKVKGNAALISAGTGLGECALVWSRNHHVPVASEGGHASFSPSNEEEIELLRYMWRTLPHVSWERLVSGSMGFENIYNFFKDTGRAEADPQLEADAAQRGYGAAVTQGMENNSTIACETMRLFVRLYGSEAGNLALKVVSTGGLYIGGGIAPKILKWMQEGEFLKAFVAKGRFQGMLEKMPVKVILESETALLGAARLAQMRL